MKSTFGNASLVGDCVVFNIAGNKYRMVARIRYKVRTVYVLTIMTHAEYDDQEKWQTECGCHREPPPKAQRPVKRAKKKA